MDDNTFKLLSLVVLSCQTIALAYIGVRQQQTHSLVNGQSGKLEHMSYDAGVHDEQARSLSGPVVPPEGE